MFYPCLAVGLIHSAPIGRDRYAPTFKPDAALEMLPQENASPAGITLTMAYGVRRWFGGQFLSAQDADKKNFHRSRGHAYTNAQQARDNQRSRRNRTTFRGTRNGPVNRAMTLNLSAAYEERVTTSTAGALWDVSPICVYGVGSSKPDTTPNLLGAKTEYLPPWPIPLQPKLPTPTPLAHNTCGPKHLLASSTMLPSD